MELVLSSTYQIVTSACFTGARKKSKGTEGTEENTRWGRGKNTSFTYRDGRI